VGEPAAAASPAAVKAPAAGRTGRLGAGPRRRRALLRLAVTAFCAGALGLAACGSARAVELCSQEGRALMRSVHISEAKIKAVCEKEARGSAPLTLRIHRTEDELGHCRVTLALVNNSTLYLNALVLTVEQARFAPFHFSNISPGGTGYASASSRVLVDCVELREVRLAFHWPPSLRIGDRSPDGQQLLYYRPYLLDRRLAWSESGTESSQ
jgi:hypothetical protein